MLGLVLEGGGARGAYEIGAIRAFFENGYKFDGAVGTSIGAINAAVVAQGEWELGGEIWSKLTPEMLFPGEGRLLEIISNGEISPEEIPGAVRDVYDVIKNGGLDTKHIRMLLEEYIDEEKIRASATEFGLVTYSVSDKKSRRFFKNDIPDGKLVEYLIASSMLPVFKREKLDGKFFVDGGYIDVCPYNMLIERGYEELVVVRVFGTGVTRRMKSKDTAINMVIPSDKLPGMLDFSKTAVRNSMEMGYFDGLRAVNGYKGRKYYIQPCGEEFCFNKLLCMDDKYRRAIGKVLGLSELPGKRMLFDGIIPLMASCLELPRNYTYEEFIISVLESAALSKKIPRFEVFTFDGFLDRIRSAVYPDPEKKHTPVSMPYRESSETSFRLPAHGTRSAYAYKAPSQKQLGTAIELFIMALCGGKQDL